MKEFSLPKSCIYVGNVMHARLAPKPHKFRYGVFSLFLDLDNVEQGILPSFLKIDKWIDAKEIILSWSKNQIAYKMEECQSWWKQNKLKLQNEIFDFVSEIPGIRRYIGIVRFFK